MLVLRLQHGEGRSVCIWRRNSNLKNTYYGELRQPKYHSNSGKLLPKYECRSLNAAGCPFIPWQVQTLALLLWQPKWLSNFDCQSLNCQSKQHKEKYKQASTNICGIFYQNCNVMFLEKRKMYCCYTHMRISRSLLFLKTVMVNTYLG